MQNRRGPLVVTLATFALTATTACGQSNAGPENARPESRGTEARSATSQSSSGTAAPVVDTDVVRQHAHYDYDPASSVAEVAERSSFAAAGEVVGWSDGRSLEESDGSGYEDTEFFAVLKVRIDGFYHAPDGHDQGTSIYVEVSRGGEIKIDGERPDGTVPVLASIDELNTAVPSGARVIVLGGEAPTAAELERQTSDGVVEGDGRGVPDGSALVRPDVQGLLFEDEDGRYVSGLADDEGWGWLPSSLPVTSGFDQLMDELDYLDN